MSDKTDPNDGKTRTAAIALAWAFVGIPLAWGIVMTLIRASALFS